MKTEEIMIGDWVHSRLHNVDTTVITVEGRGYNAVWLESKECWERHYMNEIEPIPLTEEILQKNFPDPDVITWFPQDDMPCFFNIYWESIHFGEGELRLNIQYVHELQHILRLCGIEKDIVLG